MPAGFRYLFLMKCLYDIFVAAFTSKVGSPLKLTIETLTLVMTALFLINWRQFKGRLCLICRALMKLQLMPYIPDFVMVQKFPIFAYGVMYLRDTIFLPKSPDNGSILACYIVFPNSLIIYNFCCRRLNFLQFRPILEGFLIKLVVRGIRWTSIAY